MVIQIESFPVVKHYDFSNSLPEIWVKMADARAHRVVNGGEIV